MFHLTLNTWNRNEYFIYNIYHSDVAFDGLSQKACKYQKSLNNCPKDN